MKPITRRQFVKGALIAGAGAATVGFPTVFVGKSSAGWARRTVVHPNIPTHQPNFLAMGVLSPVVDYQVATKFRGAKMGWERTMEPTRAMLEAFGYEEGDLPDGGRLLEL